MHKSAATAEPSSVRMAVADEVRGHLARCRMTQEELADQIGRTQPWLSRRLNYELPFTIDDLAVIADTLNTTVFGLLQGLEPEPDERALDRRGLRRPRSACITAEDTKHILTDVQPESVPFLIAA